MRCALCLTATLLAALVLAACSGGSDLEAGAGGTTHHVTSGPLKITLTESGTLRAKNSVKIRSKVRGQAKVMWLIEEGTTVKAGDELVKLDQTNLEKELKDLDDKVIQLEADSKSAVKNVEIQVSDNLSSIQKAELALDSAEQDLERYENGDAIQDKKNKEVRVEATLSDWERAEEKSKQTPELVKKGFMTKLDAEEERLKILKLKTEYEAARLDLDLWLKYANPMEMKRRVSKVEEAKRDLDRARLLANSRLTTKTLEKNKKERRYKAALKDLEEKREQLQYMIIKAPAPGIVVFESGRRWEQETLKVGDTAYPGRVLMKLPDLSEMQVELEIHEADITKLKVGLPATITPGSDKTLVLHGQIAKIATVGSSQGRWENTKKFAVTISIQEKDLDLRPGVSAEVEITIGEIANTITVPIQAVFAAKGKFHCWRVNGGDPERAEIVPGRSNDNFVEIKKGLSAGDRVLLYDPEGQEDTAEESGNGKSGE
jgi:HlyD family secretion protein